ncbi:MAG: hypothetical protein AAFO69_11695 [Bacteroidota bacterium]
MKITGFALFLVSLLFFVTTFVLSFLLAYISFDVIILGILGAVSIMVSFAGLMVAFNDQSGRKKSYSIFGNIFIIFVFGLIIFSSVEDDELEPEIPDLVFFSKTLKNSFGEDYVALEISQIDTLEIGDSFPVKYWHTGDAQFNEVANQFDLQYRKEFFYEIPIEGLSGKIESDSDTINLQLEIKNDQGLSVDEYSERSIRFGVRMIFEMKGFRYDTTFVNKADYYVMSQQFKI